MAGQITRLIVDCKDATKDVYLPSHVAFCLYDQGKISWDQTNEAYCLWRDNDMPLAVRENIVRSVTRARKGK